MSDHNRNEDVLVGAKACLEIIFVDESVRPSIRTLHDWRRKGYLPYHKIGKKIYFSPEQVKRAFDRNFEIKAKTVN